MTVRTGTPMNGRVIRTRSSKRKRRAPLQPAFTEDPNFTAEVEVIPAAEVPPRHHGLTGRERAAAAREAALREQQDKAAFREWKRSPRRTTTRSWRASDDT